MSRVLRWLLDGHMLAVIARGFSRRIRGGIMITTSDRLRGLGGEVVEGHWVQGSLAAKVRLTNRKQFVMPKLPCAIPI